MRAWLKEPGQPGHTVIIVDELELLQQIVGGYIETVTLADDLVIIRKDLQAGLELQHRRH